MMDGDWCEAMERRNEHLLAAAKRAYGTLQILSRTMSNREWAEWCDGDPARSLDMLYAAIIKAETS